MCEDYSLTSLHSGASEADILLVFREDERGLSYHGPRLRLGRHNASMLALAKSFQISSIIEIELQVLLGTEG